jgi:uracil-DNA glycosylase
MSNTLTTKAKLSPRLVKGEGSSHPAIMIVGEVPGDVEDKAGRPFVGPAGKLLRSLLIEIGIDAKKIFLTNAVKRFKYIPRGKRRLHQKPNAVEIRASRPMLEKEIETLKPKVIVALGATAAASLCGHPVKIKDSRSNWLESPLTIPILVSWHPSAVLRSPDADTRKEMRDQLKADLKKAWSAVSEK